MQIIRLNATDHTLIGKIHAGQDVRVFIDATDADLTITLPSCRLIENNSLYLVRTDSTGNTVTYQGSDNQTINGSATQTIAAGGFDILATDKTNWYKK